MASLQTPGPNDKQYKIADLRERGKNIEEIVNITGWSRARVRQLEYQIFKKIREVR
jgi:transcriptional regulator